MTDLRTSSNARGAALAVVAFCAAGSAFAADSDWYVKKDTWAETYLACMNGICRMEQQQGRAIPPVRNDGTLPAVLYAEHNGGLGSVALSVDVSGVRKLYLGSSSSCQFQKIVLVKADGSKQPLVVGKDLAVPYTTANKRHRFDPSSRMELREDEIELDLGGKYRRVEGKLSVGNPAMAWVDRRSRYEQWGKSLLERKRVQGYADRLINEKHPDRGQADAVRRLYQQVRQVMPSGYRPMSFPAAAAFYATTMLEKYGKRSDERIVEAIRRTAAAVRTGGDFDRLVRLSFALSSYDHLRRVRDTAAKFAECPGLATAFRGIESDFFRLDPDRMDYGLGLQERLEAFTDLMDECKQTVQLIQIARDTIEYVHKVRPVADSVRRELTALAGQLDRDKHDLDAFLATRDKIRKLRRGVIFSHPALDFDRILINRTPPTAYSHNGDQHLGRHSRVGPGLTMLTNWKSDKPTVTTLLAGKLPAGSVRNPDLHYDGEKVVFAFCPHELPAGSSGKYSKNESRFFLYEAAIDGSWVRQLTGTRRDPMKTWQDRATVLIEDNDPCYLPDGDIVFISTRGQTFGRCHGGRYNPAWILHRCDGNGDDIRQLSFGNENEYEPAVLNDGRIVFTRWEYTNRHEMLFHMLWACRPDGTGVGHYYGNDTLHPMMVVEASAIAGTDRIVATAQGHHSYNTGTTVVLDTSKGENGEGPVTHITPETPYSESRGWPSPHYSHPYPITEELFLVSRANHPVHPQGRTPPVADRGIYLVDPAGGRELIYEDSNVASFSPIAIRTRKRPPVMPPIADDYGPDYGTVLVQNAYVTRNDPEGKIKPGSIKAIRVNALGVQPRAGRSPCSMTVPVEIPKKVLGTVPVNEKGWAYFKVPARTSLQLQILDANGMAILTEKSLFYLQPGERRTCVGCHEPEGSSPVVSTLNLGPRSAPMALTPPAGPQYEGGLSFMRTVQPVLDRYCIKCHGLEKTEKGVDLTDDGGTYPRSYQALIQRGDHKVGLKSYMGGDKNISRPYRFYAHRNEVSHMLLANHGKANVDRESFLRVIEWLDLNAQCYGDLFPNKLEQRRIDPKALEQLRARAAELFGEKIALHPERALINVAQPDESRILQAPLARAAGGWGQIPAWTSTSDAGYKEIASLVDKCIVKRPDENRLGWAPTLECGGGERWVVGARESYRARLEADGQPTP